MVRSSVAAGRAAGGAVPESTRVHGREFGRRRFRLPGGPAPSTSRSSRSRGGGPSPGTRRRPRRSRGPTPRSPPVSERLRLAVVPPAASSQYQDSRLAAPAEVDGDPRVIEVADALEPQDDPSRCGPKEVLGGRPVARPPPPCPGSSAPRPRRARRRRRRTRPPRPRARRPRARRPPTRPARPCGARRPRPGARRPRNSGRGPTRPRASGG